MSRSRIMSAVEGLWLEGLYLHANSDGICNFGRHVRPAMSSRMAYDTSSKDGSWLRSCLFFFFFLFSFFLWIKLGLFLMFLLTFVFFSLITHICFSLFESGFPRLLLPIAVNSSTMSTEIVELPDPPPNVRSGSQADSDCCRQLLPL